MLKGICPLISPALLKVLSEMGHGDESLTLRSLNRRVQRPLVSADSFGFLFVATGDESLTPQRAFRSPFGNLRGCPLVAMFLLQNSINDDKDAERRIAKGDASPVASPPKAEVESGATKIGKPFGE